MDRRRPAIAQQSRWYVSDRNGFGQVHSYQNGSGGPLYTKQFQTETALYVDGTDQRIRQVGQSPYSEFWSKGGEYDLGGTFTGTVFENTLPFRGGNVLDAAFDGEHVYVVNAVEGDVYRLNQDYTNPQFLFSVIRPDLGLRVAYTITHDGTNNTLWTGEWWAGRPSKIVQWDMSGNVVSSFDAAGVTLGALAWDPADETLWVVTNGAPQLHLQYDRVGNLLGSFPKTTTRQLVGGEFPRASLSGPPSNTPPAITLCPPKATIGCEYSAGVPYETTIGVSDADNDPLTVNWSVNGAQVWSEVLVAGATSASLTHAFPFGDSTVSVSVTDGNSAPATCETGVCVVLAGAPHPLVESLPDLFDECAVTISEAPRAHACSDGSVITATTDQPLPLVFDQQGKYTVTWTYTDPNAADSSAPNATSTQEQLVIVQDLTPPTVTCPPDVTVAFGAEPAAATTVEEFVAQGGTISDNCGLEGVTIESVDAIGGRCPMTLTRLYLIADAAGNAAVPCVQTITVENLFADDAVVWQQPLARNGMSEDTDPSAGGALKYRFKLGRTVPIKIRAEGCEGDVTGNSNVSATVVVFGDTDLDGAADGNALAIDYNGGRRSRRTDGPGRRPPAVQPRHQAASADNKVLSRRDHPDGHQYRGSHLRNDSDPGEVNVYGQAPRRSLPGPLHRTHRHVMNRQFGISLLAVALLAVGTILVVLPVSSPSSRAPAIQPEQGSAIPDRGNSSAHPRTHSAPKSRRSAKLHPSRGALRFPPHSILASVNGTPIRVEQVIPPCGENHRHSSPIDRPTFESRLARAIDAELVLQAARVHGIDLTAVQQRRLDGILPEHRADLAELQPLGITWNTVSAGQVSLEHHLTRSMMLRQNLVAELHGAMPSPRADRQREYETALAELLTSLRTDAEISHHH